MMLFVDFYDIKRPAHTYTSAHAQAPARTRTAQKKGPGGKPKAVFSDLFI